MEAFLEMGNAAVHSFLLGEDISAFVVSASFYTNTASMCLR
jgi:hypothetical protein